VENNNAIFQLMSASHVWKWC